MSPVREPTIVGIAPDVAFSDEKRRSREQWMNVVLGAGARAEVVAIESGPEYLESAFDQALAGPGLLRSAVGAVDRGADAIALLCMSDPAVEGLREVIDVPVVGAAQASLQVAAMLADRVSVLTILPAAVPLIERLTRTLGVDPTTVVSVRSIDMAIKEMDEDPSAVIDALDRVAERAIQEDGAQALVLGCTEMGPDAAQTLARRAAVPVVDPNVAAFTIAHALCLSGLTHSRATYPKVAHDPTERHVNADTVRHVVTETPRG